MPVARLQEPLPTQSKTKVGIHSKLLDPFRNETRHFAGMAIVVANDHPSSRALISHDEGPGTCMTYAELKAEWHECIRDHSCRSGKPDFLLSGNGRVVANAWTTHVVSATEGKLLVCFGFGGYIYQPHVHYKIISTWKDEWINTNIIVMYVIQQIK